MMFVSVLLLLISSLMAQASNGTSSCPAPFVALGEGCYYYVVSSATWEEARLYCQTLQPGEDVDLAVFDTHCDDFEHIAEYASTKDFFYVWVGATEENHLGYWTWVDGRPVDLTATYWDVDEPISSVYANCVILYPSDEVAVRYRLFTSNCGSQIFFLCQLGVHARNS